MDIRSTNLKALVESRKWTAKDLVQRLARTTSFWSDRISGRRQIGEKLARNVEEGLGLKRGWLDDEHDAQLDASHESPIDMTAAERVSVVEAVNRLADHMEQIKDQKRPDLLDLFRTLVMAPDSRRARTAVIQALCEIDVEVLKGKRQA